MLLSIQGIDFGYSQDKLIFNNLHLGLEQGKIMALIGESGCGKTTLLNIIYGLSDWYKGKIYFDNREIYGPKANIIPGEKDMKLVAQHYDLMPYSTVYDNVGKFLSNIDLKAKRDKVFQLLEIVGLEDYIDEYPKNLSGGQKQRVAIAQALSQLPKLLLLDEPFSNLDFSRKTQLRDKLFAYVREQNISLIISTHDITEILPWIDDVVVLQDGRLIQKDSPEAVFQSPYNPYVARLLGEVNILTPEQQQELGLPKWFYFPHQLKFSEQEGTDAEVIESGFSGGFYRNLVNVNDHTFIVYTAQKKEGKLKISFL
ncbi:ABC transporter ATP-binding protein [Elizabethkingia anophelis]|nr:ABC transporter ATP-binding protein [Elizabethkingia anophelis]